MSDHYNHLWVGHAHIHWKDFKKSVASVCLVWQYRISRDLRKVSLKASSDANFFCHYILLAKVPALSCMLGRVPYYRAFGALTSDCAPIWSCLRCSHSALLIHYKKVWLKKNLASTGIEFEPSDMRAGCTINTAHWTFITKCKKCSKYYQLCVGCGFAGISARNVYTLAFNTLLTANGWG